MPDFFHNLEFSVRYSAKRGTFGSNSSFILTIIPAAAKAGKAKGAAKDAAKGAAKGAATAADSASSAAAGTTAGTAGAADAQQKLVEGKDKGGDRQS